MFCQECDWGYAFLNDSEGRREVYGKAEQHAIEAHPRAKVVAMENSEQSEVPLIGRDIPWEAIEGEFCRVKHFTPLAVVESGKVKSASTMLPYASLKVELPDLSEHPDYQQKLKGIILPHEALMPVMHKLDFRNLWEVFKEIDVSKDPEGALTNMEVLVVYAPLKRRKLTGLFSGILPSLVIQLYPKGSLERLYEKPEKGKVKEWFESLRPIAEWDARPENLK